MGGVSELRPKTKLIVSRSSELVIRRFHLMRLEKGGFPEPPTTADTDPLTPLEERHDFMIRQRFIPRVFLCKRNHFDGTSEIQSLRAKSQSLSHACVASGTERQRCSFEAPRVVESE